MYLKIFTYNDYIKCIHTLRLNAVLQLAEESTEYNLELKDTKKEKNKHDKLTKIILKNEKEMAQFINQFLEPNRKINSNNLEKYKKSYINKKYKNKEADLVYKLKSDDVFFLIEHQSKLDYSMPYRILNYCIDIMQEWSRNKRNEINILYPIIVPIIIYTGERVWKIPKNFKDKQISNYVFENYKIDLQYNLIDINKLTTSFLLQQKTMFGYGIIIEKSKNKDELRHNINLIIDDIKTKEQLELLREIIIYLFNGSIEKQVKEEILNKIEIKIEKEEESMGMRDRIVAEN